MATQHTPRSHLAAPSARFFHGAPPRSVELHPRGRLLLLASRDCVRVMRAESGETVLVVAGFPERLTALGRFVFLAGGARFAGFVSEGNESTLRVWSTESGEELSRFGESTGPIGAIVCGSGDRVVAATKDGVVVWDLATGAVVAKIEYGGRRFCSATLDASGTRLCTLFQMHSKTERLRGSLEHEIHDLATGKVVARQVEEGAWEWTDRDPIRGAFLADGSVVVGTYGRVDFFGPELTNRTRVDFVDDVTLDVVASPDGSRALVTWARQYDDPVFEFVVEGSRVVSLPSLAVDVLPMPGTTGAFLHDGRLVLALTSGVLRGDGVAHPDPPRRFTSISQVGDDLFVADETGGGLRLDPATLELRGEATATEEDARRLRFARSEITRDGLYLIERPAAGGVTVRRASTGAVQWEDRDATAYALAPDGTSIGCGTNLSIGGLRRRRLADGSVIATAAPYSSQSNAARLTAVAFAADGRIGGADAGGVVMLYQKDESREFDNVCYTLRRRVGSLAWHPDGKRAAVGLGGDRGSILILGGKEAAYLLGHVGEVAALWFTPDGTRLVSAGKDGHCFTWDVPPAVLPL